MGRKKKCHCLCFVIYRCQGKGNAPLGVEKKAFDAIDVITLLTFRYYTHAQYFSGAGSFSFSKNIQNIEPLFAAI